MRNRAGLLALVVLGCAILLMVFVVMPRLGEKAAEPAGSAAETAGQEKPAPDAVAQAPAPEPAKPAPSTEPAASAPAPKEARVAPAAPSPDGAGAAGQPAAAATADKRPSFDVLRVEPDGSAVIAGTAAPNGRLEVLDGNNKVVSSTAVDPSGDFAMVLEQPLSPGDHQLTLKTTGQDGKSQTSEEVATISVPQNRDASQLLAMVSKPGEASRIVKAPRLPGAAEDMAQPQAGAPAAGAPAASSVAAARPANPAAAAGDAPASDLMVTAVEIEGDKIFVAGKTRPDTDVAAYADDQPIGTAKSAANGNFVVEGKLSLSVGDHRIRVDAMDGGGKVTVRTTVDFTRPAGNQMTVAAQGGAAAASPDAAPLEQAAFDKLRGDAIKAFGLLKTLFEGGRVPDVEQLAAARSSTALALRSVAEYRPVVDAPAAFKEMTAKTSRTAYEALTMLQNLPADAKSVAGALDRLGQMVAALAPEEPGAPAPGPTSAMSSANGEPKLIEQAPLAASNDTVIIRRGDTLWQISRRVYGAGVRYTTIYIANEDKIVNPDRILPGQIFGLPKDALPNSEELHRKRMKAPHP